VRAVHGVGRVRFRLEYGGFLELDGVLFVSGLRVLALSLSFGGCWILHIVQEGTCIYLQGGSGLG
jgi:hypothetical protein